MSTELDPEIVRVGLYGFGTLLGVIGSMGLIIFKMIQAEAKKHRESIDAKASIDSLREAKEMFDRDLNRLRADHQERMRELSAKQEKEIEWLKKEMDGIVDTLNEMRRDFAAGNTNVMKSIQELTLLFRSSQS